MLKNPALFEHSQSSESEKSEKYAEEKRWSFHSLQMDETHSRINREILSKYYMNINEILFFFSLKVPPLKLKNILLQLVLISYEETRKDGI